MHIAINHLSFCEPFLYQAAHWWWFGHNLGTYKGAGDRGTAVASTLACIQSDRFHIKAFPHLPGLTDCHRRYIATQFWLLCTLYNNFTCAAPTQLSIRLLSICSCEGSTALSTSCTCRPRNGSFSVEDMHLYRDSTCIFTVTAHGCQSWTS